MTYHKINTNLEPSIASPHSSSTQYRQSSLTSSTSSIEIQGRPPLQALPLNINSQTPVIVHNKDGTIRKRLGRKPGSKNKQKI